MCLPIYSLLNRTLNNHPTTTTTTTPQPLQLLLRRRLIKTTRPPGLAIATTPSSMLNRIRPHPLQPLSREALDTLASVKDLPRLARDIRPVIKRGEGNALALAVGDEVLAGFGEEEVGFACGGEVADAVAGLFILLVRTCPWCDQSRGMGERE